MNFQKKPVVCIRVDFVMYFPDRVVFCSTWDGKLKAAASKRASSEKKYIQL